MTEIRVPAMLVNATGLPSDVVEADGNTVADVLEHLTERYAELKPHFTNIAGALDDTPWTIFKNGVAVSITEPVGPTDEIEIIASMSGGLDEIET